jgi:hypothetical protein
MDKPSEGILTLRSASSISESADGTSDTKYGTSDKRLALFSPL